MKQSIRQSINHVHLLFQIIINESNQYQEVNIKDS